MVKLLEKTLTPNNFFLIYQINLDSKEEKQKELRLQDLLIC
jgi:hypothetical protein